jgi:hypothetical protein
MGRWKGSITKLIYPNITLFLLLYTLLRQALAP